MKKFLSSTPFLTNGLLVVALLITFIGSWVVNQIFAGDVINVNRYTSLFIAIGAQMVFLGSLIIAIRREMPRPGLPSITGRWAVFWGVAGCFFWGSCEIFLIFDFLRSF